MNFRLEGPFGVRYARDGGVPRSPGMDLEDPDLDAEQADCVLQKAAFGDIVYG